MTTKHSGCQTAKKSAFVRLVPNTNKWVYAQQVVFQLSPSTQLQRAIWPKLIIVLRIVVALIATAFLDLFNSYAIAVNEKLGTDELNALLAISDPDVVLQNRAIHRTRDDMLCEYRARLD